MTEQNILNTISLPDEVGHFIFKVYGTSGYHPCSPPKSTTWKKGTPVMLYNIKSMDSYDYYIFKRDFGYPPKVTKETAPWFIERHFDVFGFIEKGWIVDENIFDEKGYDAAIKAKDRAMLKYQRQIRKEEEKLGRKEESKTSLLERRSWVTFGKMEVEPIYEQTLKTSYGYEIYNSNEIGKITQRTTISEDGEIMYQGTFSYRYHKGNYFLYKYENTEGVCANYDTIANERRRFKGNF